MEVRMNENERRRRTLAMVALLISSVALVFVGGVAGQTDTPQPIEENASYYDDKNGTTNTTEWVPGDGNATAGGMLDMISRIPGIFIGVGPQDPSKSGAQGYLLTGIVIGGAALFATIGVGVGPIAGSMLGTVLAFVLTMPAIGLIPIWIRPLLLFTLVGIPASAAMLRVFNR